LVGQSSIPKPSFKRARISIHNGDNAVLKKIEDPRYVPQDAQDEMRVARALSVSFVCAAAGKKGQMF
jgi:hypothetical protein